MLAIMVVLPALSVYLRTKNFPNVQQQQQPCCSHVSVQGRETPSHLIFMFLFSLSLSLSRLSELKPVANSSRAQLGSEHRAPHRLSRSRGFGLCNLSHSLEWLSRRRRSDIGRASTRQNKHKKKKEERRKKKKVIACIEARITKQPGREPARNSEPPYRLGRRSFLEG